MTDDKIINLFQKKNNPDFAGFKYLKLTRDNNGMVFNEEKLLEYAQSCHYVVRVMRNVNNEVCLYNFDIPSENLASFLQSFENNTLKGTVIEVEKFIPKGSA